MSKKLGYCDNTDCETPDEKQELYKVKLTDEFDSGKCKWCHDCVERDDDMVETANK